MLCAHERDDLQIRSLALCLRDTHESGTIMSDECNSPVLPVPIVKRRVVDERIEQRAQMLGFSPVVARVLGGRRSASSLDLPTWLAPSLAHLDPEDILADIDLAAQRLAGTILADEVIGIATDYDMDGFGAHAAFRTALVMMLGHPPQRLRSYRTPACGRLWAHGGDGRAPRVHLVYGLADNRYGGLRRLELRIEARVG